MPVNRLGVAVASALCVASVAHGESVADAGWAKMTQCAAISEDRARHACTDNALRDAGLLKATGLPAANTPTANTASSATPPPPSLPLPPPPPQKKERQHYEVTLSKVERGGDGKLVLTTSDGGVWQQVESGAVTQIPKQGETMEIEARSLGGFMCHPSKYVSFRCYRSR